MNHEIVDRAGVVWHQFRHLAAAAGVYRQLKLLYPRLALRIRQVGSDLLPGV